MEGKKQTRSEAFATCVRLLSGPPNFEIVGNSSQPPEKFCELPSPSPPLRQMKLTNSFPRFATCVAGQPRASRRSPQALARLAQINQKRMNDTRQSLQAALNQHSPSPRHEKRRDSSACRPRADPLAASPQREARFSALRTERGWTRRGTRTARLSCPPVFRPAFPSFPRVLGAAATMRR